MILSNILYRDTLAPSCAVRCILWLAIGMSLSECRVTLDGLDYVKKDAPVMYNQEPISYVHVLLSDDRFSYAAWYTYSNE